MGDVGRETGDGDKQDPDGAPASPVSRPSSATIGELLTAASAALADTSDTPRLDAEVLLAHVLGRDRIWLFTWSDRQPSAAEQAQFLALLERRALGEPVA